MVSPAATGYCELNQKCLNTPLDSMMSLAFLGFLVVIVWLFILGCMVLSRHIAGRLHQRRQMISLSQETNRTFPAEAATIRPYETLDEYVRRVSR